MSTPHPRRLLHRLAAHLDELHALYLSIYICVYIYIYVYT